MHTQKRTKNVEIDLEIDYFRIIFKNRVPYAYVDYLVGATQASGQFSIVEQKTILKIPDKATPIQDVCHSVLLDKVLTREIKVSGSLGSFIFVVFVAVGHTFDATEK